MSSVAAVIAPILLLIGTAGLLLNEFAFEWGRPATLLFAAFNIVGVVITFAVVRKAHIR